MCCEHCQNCEDTPCNSYALANYRQARQAPIVIPSAGISRSDPRYIPSFRRDQKLLIFVVKRHFGTISWATAPSKTAIFLYSFALDTHVATSSPSGAPSLSYKLTRSNIMTPHETAMRVSHLPRLSCCAQLCPHGMRAECLAPRERRCSMA